MKDCCACEEWHAHANGSDGGSPPASSPPWTVAIAAGKLHHTMPFLMIINHVAPSGCGAFFVIAVRPVESMESGVWSSLCSLVCSSGEPAWWFFSRFQSPYDLLVLNYLNRFLCLPTAELRWFSFVVEILRSTLKLDIQWRWFVADSQIDASVGENSLAKTSVNALCSGVSFVCKRSVRVGWKELIHTAVSTVQGEYYPFKDDVVDIIVLNMCSLLSRIW